MKPYVPTQKPYWKINQTERRVMLFIGDLVIAGLALLTSIFIWSQAPAEWLNFSSTFLHERVPVWFYLMPFIWLVLMVDMYDVQRANNRQETVKGVSIAAALSAGLYLIVYFSSQPDSMPRRGVAGFVVSVYLLTLLWRFIYIAIFTQPQFLRRVLIVGAGNAGTSLVNVYNQLLPQPFYLVGFIDDDIQKTGMEIGGFHVLGTSSKLIEIIRENSITDLVCAISGEMEPETVNTLLLAEEAGIEITTMPIMYEKLLGRVPIFLLQSDWILRSFVDHVHLSGTFEIAKRLLDISVGFIGFLLLALLFPFIGLGILLDTGRPIIYYQDRLGKNGKKYRMIKFRTMEKNAEKDGIARPASNHDERITRIGKFLRKSHLDELPQVINILRGEMSLVGPRSERPELVEEWERNIPF